MRDGLDIPEWVNDSHGIATAHADEFDGMGRAEARRRRERREREELEQRRREREERQREQAQRQREQAQRQREAHQRSELERRAQAPTRGSRHGHNTSPRAALVRRRRLTLALTFVSTFAFVWSILHGGEPSLTVSNGAAMRRPVAEPAVAQSPAPKPAPAAEVPSVAPHTARPKASAAAPKQAPKAGSGRVSPLVLPAIAGSDDGGARTFRIGLSIEGDVGVDGEAAARIIADTLGDKRGWRGSDDVAFVPATTSQTAAGDTDMTIVLASPTMTDRLCAPLRTNGVVSCYNNRKVVVNTLRWIQGVKGYGSDLAAYRQYMINHEVGHGLGYGHVSCPGKGETAPLMLQQSKGLEGCLPNPWPTKG